MKNSAGGVDDADVSGPAFHFDLRLDLIEDDVVIERLDFPLAESARSADPTRRGTSASRNRDCNGSTEHRSAHD